MVTFVSMSESSFSFIIPVYNRPEEIRELLESFKALKNELPYEIVIVEDGSQEKSDVVVRDFQEALDISYYYKENSGPGDSRNYGMAKAKGNYFIILDSDCILPNHYLNAVDASLKEAFVHCFGGPDAAHESFSKVQKAINFSMTSFITTGGIRGKENSVGKFQPRSFNMGLSKTAFLATQGFGKIHPGEDPDLTIRLWRLGYKTKLIPHAFVYHKRRISWSKFYKQVNKFGLVRPILNKRYPETNKPVFWMPTLFVAGLLVAWLLAVLGNSLLLMAYACYFTLGFLVALWDTKNLYVAIMAVYAIFIQFLGYGLGFLKATWFVGVLNRNPKQVFPHLFF